MTAPFPKRSCRDGVAVNAAIRLERPLLVKGEPGTGKTGTCHAGRQCAGAAADRMARQVHHQGAAGAVRIRRRQPACATASLAMSASMTSSQLHQARQALGGLQPTRKTVLLIDEIDKADIEFPTTCCRNSTGWSSSSTRPARRSGQQRPIVIITSNNEKELPDAFLRRCFFHYIRFPTWRRCRRSSRCIIRASSRHWCDGADAVLRDPRPAAGLKKKPSTSEALDWIKAAGCEDVAPEDLRRDAKNALPKLHGAL
jgi:MoxR-like ATPase